MNLLNVSLTLAILISQKSQNRIVTVFADSY